jgi:hypothetical protein
MPGLRAAAVFAVVILAACAATAVNRDWTYSRYLVDDEDARPQAAAALVEHDRCRVCFSTRERAIDWRWLQPNGAAGVNVESAVEARTARVRVVLAGAADALRFGRVLAEFGDQSSTPWTGVIGERDFTHRYAQPGHYLIDVRLQLRNGEVRRERHAVTIAGP